MVGTLALLAIGALVARGRKPSKGRVGATLLNRPTSKSPLQDQLAQAVKDKQLPPAILNPKTQKQLCEIGDASLKIAGKVLPIPPQASAAWSASPCEAKSAFLFGTILPGAGVVLGPMIGFMAQDEKFSQRFRNERSKALKSIGLYDVAKNFAKVSNPVYQVATDLTVGAAKVVNKILPF